MIIYVADFFWFFFVFCLQKTPILQKSFAKNKKQKIWKPYCTHKIEGLILVSFFCVGCFCEYITSF